MYRLLIVTLQPETKRLISDFSKWDQYGFKLPHTRDTSSGAIECMGKHAIDAVAIDSDSCFSDFMLFLQKAHPEIPMFPIAKSESELQDILLELSHLLDRIKADDSNDSTDPCSMLQQQRARWMRQLISGMEHNPELIRRRMLLHRCTESPNSPCVLACLQMCQDDSFFNERWHYGQDRLEMALRNFFGSEYAGMNITVSVVSPEEIRVLFCSSGNVALDEIAIKNYVSETSEQIYHYLGLSLQIREIRSLSSILEFSGIQN